MVGIISNTHEVKQGYFVAEIALNSPETLNALNLEMIKSIHEKFIEWKSDRRILMIFLSSTSEKSFCAGGDVTRLFERLDISKNNSNYPISFFGNEYVLDFEIHNYPKPIICWGNGIVMGGGMGLFNGCSHRIVTESTKIAMPESLIGFYPDVGGSWFLNKIPQFIANFLCLTGASINPKDSIYLHFSDFYIQNKFKESVIADLVEYLDGSYTQEKIGLVLEKYSKLSKKEFLNLSSDINENIDDIYEIFSNCSVKSCYKLFTSKHVKSSWLRKAKESFFYGSILSFNLILEQLKRSKFLSLREVFEKELTLTLNCIKNGDFREGVRALLIDKDKKPDWLLKNSEDENEKIVKSFFHVTWTENPISKRLKNISDFRID